MSKTTKTKSPAGKSSPLMPLWVREFSIPSDLPAETTFYRQDDGGLILALEGPCDIIAANPTVGAVAVLLGCDDSEYNLVQIDASHAEVFEVLTNAAQEILRVRDRLLTMHGYNSYDEWMGPLAGVEASTLS